MKETILFNLNRIEEEHKVKIILACESGSRAWGFPSTDSDYDVRFIYANPLNWYLSIVDKRDVIELPLTAELDITGWDLRKSIRLLRKSNSPLLEWLSSQIRYRSDSLMLEPLISLSERAFLPETSYHHYLSMAKTAVSNWQSDEFVKIKTYMYALRPILCCQWIKKHLSQPPMLMDDLLSEMLTDKKIKNHIEGLIDIKKKHPESFLIHRSPMLENYLMEQISDLENDIPKNSCKSDVEEFDNIFRMILNYCSRA